MNIKDKHPIVPWQTLVRLRNHLVHDYALVDLPLLWKTITCEFPKLISEIESILASEPA